jgi:tRNA (guanine37-N1)-methyltransferase
MVLIDAVSRQIPGVLGHEEAAREDSFSHGLLEYPQYTKPRDFRGLRVPEVLISGNHQEIQRWRRKESIRRTRLRRPDLLEKVRLSPDDRKALDE